MAGEERLICASVDVVDGGLGFRFEVKHRGEDVQAFVIRYEGVVHGYLNRCGHVPAEIDWKPGHFFDRQGQYLICASHGALYAPDTGKCLGGACRKAGLAPLAVVEHDGAVYLSKV